MVELKEIQVSSVEKDIPIHLSDRERCYFDLSMSAELLIQKLDDIIKRYNFMFMDDFVVNYGNDGTRKDVCVKDRSLQYHVNGNLTGSSPHLRDCYYALDCLNIDYVCYKGVSLAMTLSYITPDDVRKHRAENETSFTGELMINDREVSLDRKKSLRIGICDKSMNVCGGGVIGNCMVRLDGLGRKGCFMMSCDDKIVKKKELRDVEEFIGVVGRPGLIVKNMEKNRDISVETENDKELIVKSSNKEAKVGMKYAMSDARKGDCNILERAKGSFSHLIDVLLADSALRQKVNCYCDGYIVFYVRSAQKIDKNIFIEYCIERRNLPMKHSEIEAFSILSDIPVQKLVLEYLNTQVKLFMADGNVDIDAIIYNLRCAFHYKLVSGEDWIRREFNAMLVKLFEMIEERICEHMVGYEECSDALIYVIFMILVSSGTKNEDANVYSGIHAYSQTASSYTEIISNLKRNYTNNLFGSNAYYDVYKNCEKALHCGSMRLIDEKQFNELLNCLVVRNRRCFLKNYEYREEKWGEKSVDGSNVMQDDIDGRKKDATQEKEDDVKKHNFVQNTDTNCDDLAILNRINKLVPVRITDCSNIFLRERLIRHFKLVFRVPWTTIRSFFYELKHSKIFNARIYLGYEGYEDLLDLNSILLDESSLHNPAEIFIFFKKLNMDDLQIIHTNKKEMQYLFGDSFEMFYRLERLRVIKRFVSKYKRILVDSVIRKRYKGIREIMEKGARFGVLGEEGIKTFKMVLYEECVDVVRGMRLTIDMQMCKMIIQ